MQWRWAASGWLVFAVCLHPGTVTAGATATLGRAMADQPQITLPRASEAIVSPEKLRDYALDPEHPTGRHKARVFHSALGIGQDDWAYLRDQIVGRIGTAEPTAVKVNPYGRVYEVPIPIDGLNGAQHLVLTAWQVENDSELPSLVTLYVDTP